MLTQTLSLVASALLLSIPALATPLLSSVYSAPLFNLIPFTYPDYNPDNLVRFKPDPNGDLQLDILNLPVVPNKRDQAPNWKRETNADRFARGLPPLPPSKPRTPVPRSRTITLRVPQFHTCSYYSHFSCPWPPLNCKSHSVSQKYMNKR